MISRLSEWLFPSRTLRLELGREPSDVIANLRSRTRAFGLRSFFYTGLVGRVDERRVRVRYKMPLQRTGYEEVFDGHFETIADRTYLIGRLRHRLLDRVIFFVWAGFIAVIWVTSLVMIFRIPATGVNAPLFVLFPPALIAAGIGILRFHQWRAKGITARLISELRDAAATPHVAGDSASGFRAIP
jgi:hypothetical protein